MQSKCMLSVVHDDIERFFVKGCERFCALS